MNCVKCGGENTSTTVHLVGTSESWEECQKCGFVFPSVVIGWVKQGKTRCYFDNSAKSLCGKLIKYNPFGKGGAYGIYIWSGGSSHNLLHPDNCPECVDIWIKRKEEFCKDIGSFYDFLWEYFPLLDDCADSCEHFKRELGAKNKVPSCEVCKLYNNDEKTCLIRKSQKLISELFSKETVNSKNLRLSVNQKEKKQP